MLSACVAGIEGIPPEPSAVQAPTLDDIGMELKAAGTGHCMNSGEAWSAIMPDCIWTNVDAANRRYSLVISPESAWLTFDEATRTVSSTLVPRFTDPLTATYTCYSALDDAVTDSVTFIINDCDHPDSSADNRGITDEIETIYGEPPRIDNAIGYVLLNDFNVDVYMPPYATGTDRKTPWATAIRVGLDPLNPLDDTEDFDGDGLTNLWEAEFDTNLYIRTLAPAYTVSPANSSTFDFGITYADFNNDGFNDMAVGLFNGRIGVHLWNDAAGAFDPEVSYGFAGVVDPIIDMVSGDFNGDHCMDVAAAVDFAFDFLIVYGDCTGSLKLQQLDNLAGAEALTLGDYDGDGDLDIALIDEFQVRIYLYNPATDFFVNTVTYSAGGDPTDVVNADINGDLNLDLIITDDNLNQIRVYLGNGDGTFTFPPVTYDIGNNPSRITLADFDMDGFIDAMVSEDVNSLALFTGNGDGTFNPRSVVPLTSSIAALTAADFNGDNAIDLAMLPAGQKMVMIGLNTVKATGTVGFSERTFGTAAACQSVMAFDIGNVNMLSVAVTDPGILAQFVRLYVQ